MCDVVVSFVVSVLFLSFIYGVSFLLWPSLGLFTVIVVVLITSFFLLFLLGQ